MLIAVGGSFLCRNQQVNELPALDTELILLQCFVLDGSRLILRRQTAQSGKSSAYARQLIKGSTAMLCESVKTIDYGTMGTVIIVNTVNFDHIDATLLSLFNEAREKLRFTNPPRAG